MQKEITINVNGVAESRAVGVEMTLLQFLRDALDLTGAKEGCNEGECGACVVLVDGKAVNSCLMLAVEADGCEVQTIESLGNAEKLHPLQRAFLKHHAAQCGFCTPGMILTALAFLQENPQPSRKEVRHALAGNLCRCTGYVQIVDAVMQAAAEMRGDQDQA
jgi:carbon-monoxide dehydrogenase small subunit